MAKPEVAGTLEAVQSLDIDFLRECFDYNPDTGILKWKSRPLHHFESEHRWKHFNAVYAGKVTGKGRKGKRGDLALTTSDYCYKILTHHLVWRLSGRDLVEDTVIDHINRNPSDNRISNLRQCPQAKNVINRRMGTNNTSGCVGVYREDTAWTARVSVDGKVVRLGRFDTKEEAVEARKKAEVDAYGEYLPLQEFDISPEDEKWLNSIGSL